MHSLSVILASCLMVAAVSAADPKPCCLGNNDLITMKSIVAFGQESNGQPSGGVMDAEVYLHGKGNKFALKQELPTVNGVIKMRVLQRDEDDGMWIMLTDSKTCYKQVKQLISFCIPDDAEFMGTRDMGGLGGSSLKVNVFKYSSFNGSNSAYNVEYLSADSCAPIYTNRVSRGTNFYQSSGVSMTDVQAAVKDMSVFTLPDYCATNDNFDLYSQQYTDVQHALRANRWLQ